MSKTNRNVSRFRPTPMDALVILAVLFWICGAICSAARVSDSDSFNFNYYLWPMLCGGAAALMAIGGTLAYGRPNWKRIFLLALVIVGGFVLYAFAGPWITTRYPLQWDSFDNPVRYLFNAADQTQFRFRAAAMLLGAFIAGLIANLIFRYGVLFGDRLVRMSWRVFKSHRTKCMAVVAILLFVIGMIQTIFFPEGFFASTGGWRFLGHAVQIAGYVTVVALVACLPIRLASSPRWFGVKFIAFSVAGLATSAALFTLWEQPAFSDDPFQTFVLPAAWIVTPLIFGLSILGLSRVSEPLETNNPTEAIPNVNSQQGRVSVWSFIVSIPLITCLCVGLFLYDPGVLVHFQAGYSQTFENRFEAARTARTVARDSRGVLNLVITRFHPFWWARIENESDPGCLNALSHFIDVEDVVIENLQPHIDLSKLHKGVRPSIKFREGAITSNQLKDIHNKCRLIGFSNCDLPASFDSSYSLPNLLFFGNESFPISDFLDEFIVEFEQAAIMVQAPISIEDWEGLVRASRNRPVTLFRDIPAEVLKQEHASDISLKNISLYPDTDPFNDPSLMKFIVNTDIKVDSVFGRTPNEKECWDFAFGTGNLLHLNYFRHSESESEFLMKAKRNNWSYGWNDLVKLEMIWIPETFVLDDFAEAFSDVKTLRMDFRGILNSYRPSPMSSSYYESFENLTSVERLYLPSRWHYGDLQFLDALEHLQHLQIRSQDRTLQPGSGFEKCTQLESLLLFGTPDAQTIGELGKLKKLKQLTIVDDDLSFPLPADREKLEMLFPNVEVLIVRSEDYEPELSDTFQQHIDKIRERLIKRASAGNQEIELPAK